MAASALSLPAEILCMIFLYVNDIYYPGYSLKLRALWIFAVTGTCRRWRQVALGYATLWAGNVCHLPSNNATDCFLERAQSASLTFRTTRHHSPAHLTDHQQVLLKRHLSRVKVIDCPLPHRFADVLQKQPMPQLTVLRVRYWHKLAASDRSFEPTSIALNAPNLRELELFRVSFSVNAPNLHTLWFTNRDDRHGLSASSLLYMLREMPLLERLTLHGALYNRQGENTYSSTTRIDLPHLRHITLDSHRRGFSFCPMFGFLQIPRNTDVTVQQAGCSPATSLADLLANLKIHRSPICDALIVRNTSKDIRTIWRSSVCARKARNRNAKNRNTAQELMLRLSAAYPPDADSHQRDYIKSAGQFLPLACRENIRFLDLGDMLHTKECDVGGMRALLVPFANAECVLLSVHPRRQHVLALCEENSIEYGPIREDDDVEDAMPGSHRAEAGYALPVLRHLVVSELSHDPCERKPSRQLSQSWQTIIHVLKKRRRAGYPIRSLTLSGTFRLPKLIRGSNNQEAFKACDEAYQVRTRKLVDTLVDARGNGYEWETRTVLEYDMHMRALGG